MALDNTDKTYIANALRAAADSIASNATFDPIEAAFRLAATNIDGVAPTPTPTPTPEAPPTPGTDYTLVVDDTFNAATLDTQRWVIAPDGSPGLGTHTGANRDFESVTVAGGTLQLVGQKNRSDDMDYNHYFTGLAQMSKKPQTFGKWDVSAKVAGGRGFAPLFGLWPVDNNLASTEIRIQSVAADRQTFKIECYKGGSSLVSTTITKDLTALHKFTIEWTSTFLKFYCDDALVWTVTDTAYIPTNAHHFFAYVEVGPPAAGIQTGDPDRATLTLDYVRQYTWNGATTPTAPGSGGGSVTPTPTPTPTPEPTTPPPSTGPSSTLAATGKGLFVDLDNNAITQAQTWLTSRPADSRKMDRLGHIAQGTWIGGWSNTTDIRNKVIKATNQNQIFQCVFYNIVGRDAGSFSAGGASSYDAYNAFVDAYANAMNVPGATVLVVLEPDSLPQLLDIPESQRPFRLAALRRAAQVFKSKGFFVYQDAGHNNWWSTQVMAERLTACNIDIVDGFALNTSNNCPDNVKGSTGFTLLEFAKDLSIRCGGKHAVIDSSRNGGSTIKDWCNPRGTDVKFGREPTLATGYAYVDAYIWTKRPGESDGNCNGGPNAGEWWPEYALELANATWPTMT